MSWIGESWRRLIFLARRGQLERELEEEMRMHAERRAGENRARGMPPEEADFAARRQFGNAARQREESRQFWGFPLLESIAQDVRYGLRGLRKAPGFTTVALLTLALGIGAATAIFSIVNTVLLRPLPYKDSARLVRVWTVNSMFPEFRMGQSVPNLRDIEAQSHSLEATAVYLPQKKSLTGAGEPELLSAAAVSPGFFSLFGIHPVLGREFRAEDEQRQEGDVALLSHDLWRSRFGGDANIVGRVIQLEQQPYTVAGVLPPKFTFPGKTDVWVPLIYSAKDRQQRGNWMYFMLGRLRPGVPVRSAQAEMDNIAAGLARRYPEDSSGVSFLVMTVQSAIVGGGKAQLLSLLGAVGFLLLIACANVSNLVLSRGLQRQREIAVRAALGAGRGRILRQLLVESLVLALAGGALGLAIATAGVGAFRALAPADFPRLDELQVEPVTALIAFAISALAGILSGSAPAFSAARPDLEVALREKSAAVSAPVRWFSLRSFLVVAEVTLALVLLTGSALMVQSMARMLNVQTGLRTDHLLTAQLKLAKTRYGSADAQRLFIERLLQSLQAQPRFNGVAISNNTLMNGSMALLHFDPSQMGSREKSVNLEARSVSPGYFDTMGVALRSGRLFTNRDVKGSPQVVIINESLARRFFPGQDPAGKVLKLGPKAEDQFQVIGVTADTRDIHLRSEPRMQVYFPLLQDPYDQMIVLVRSQFRPAEATADLQKAVWQVDKDLPLNKAQSMDDIIAESVAEPRFRAWLLSAFAFSGLALTLIGIYGVISYTVGRRTHELGIRFALGAQPANVLWLVLRHAVSMALAGAVLGTIGSALLMRLLASQLFEIKPGDPLTLAGSALAMVVVAVGASYIPARRAARVDPMVALREQ